MIDGVKRWGVVVCMMLGCSHDKAPAAPPPPPKTQCAQVADHLVLQMAGAQKASPEEVDPYRQLIEKRCTDDQWSAKIQSCLLASNTLAENELCEPMFSEEQNANLHRDGDAIGKTAKKRDPTDDATEERSRAPAPKGGHKTGDPDTGGQ
jgi:hypothetical protein